MVLKVEELPADLANSKNLVDVKEAPRATVLCLAAAHAMVRLDDGTVVGDPMEKTTLESLGWVVDKGEFVHLYRATAYLTCF